MRSKFYQKLTCNGYPLMATIQSYTANLPSRSMRPPGSIPWTISRPSVSHSQGTTWTPKGPISLGITISNDTSSVDSIGAFLEGLLEKTEKKDKLGLEWWWLRRRCRRDPWERIVRSNPTNIYYNGTWSWHMIIIQSVLIFRNRLRNTHLNFWPSIRGGFYNRRFGVLFLLLVLKYYFLSVLIRLLHNLLNFNSFSCKWCRN